jgi:hypothetical protein
MVIDKIDNKHKKLFQKDLIKVFESDAQLL